MNKQPIYYTTVPKQTRCTFHLQSMKKSVNKHHQYIYKGIATSSIYTCHPTATWVCLLSARKKSTCKEKSSTLEVSRLMQGWCQISELPNAVQHKKYSQECLRKIILVLHLQSTNHYYSTPTNDLT